MIIQCFLEKVLEDLALDKKNISLVVESDSSEHLYAKVFEDKIVWSENNFVDLYFIIFDYLEKNGLYLNHNIKTYYMVSKCCLAHEVGHLLDDKGKHYLNKRNQIAQRFNNNPKQSLIRKYQRLSLKLENRAWDIIEKEIEFDDTLEHRIFLLIKEFGLQSYAKAVC